MTKPRITEVASIRMQQLDFASIHCEDARTGNHVARVEIEFHNEALEIYVHSDKRCAAGKCQEPVYRMANGKETPKTAGEELRERLTKPKDQPEITQDGRDKIKSILEGIFGKGTVEEVSIQDMFKGLGTPRESFSDMLERMKKEGKAN